LSQDSFHILALSGGGYKGLGYLGSEQKLFEKKLSFDSDPKY